MRGGGDRCTLQAASRACAPSQQLAKFQSDSHMNQFRFTAAQPWRFHSSTSRSSRAFTKRSHSSTSVALGLP